LIANDGVDIDGELFVEDEFDYNNLNVTTLHGKREIISPLTIETKDELKCI
jgi:hypothetical protein